MRVVGETYLFINFWMDFLSLLLAARLRRARFHVLRGLLGALLGSVYAAAAWTGGSAFRGFPALLLSMLAVAVISFGKAGLSLFPWVTASALLLCGLTDTMLKNGASVGAVLATCGLAAAGVCLLQGRHKTAQDGTLILVYQGKRVSLPVLRDSGNLLTDGVTGLPVIVAPERAVAALLPDGMHTADFSTLPPGWRLLPIRTAAGNATLMCFRADKTEIRTNGKSQPIQAAIAISRFDEKAALVPEALFLP